MIPRCPHGIACVVRSVRKRVLVYPFVMLLLLVPSVSAQSTDPDAHGFIVAQPEQLRPTEGSRSVRMVGDARESGQYVTRITFAEGPVHGPISTTRLVTLPSSKERGGWRMVRRLRRTHQSRWFQ